MDGCFHPLTNGRDLNHYMCSHGSFGLSVIPFPFGMRRHMFVFLVCILTNNFDASFHWEKIGDPFLLDDSYIYWVVHGIFTLVTCMIQIFLMILFLSLIVPFMMVVYVRS